MLQCFVPGYVSWTKLIDHFRSCFNNLLGQSGTLLNLGLAIPLLRQSFLSILSVSCELWVFPSGWWEPGNIPDPITSTEHHPFNPFKFISPASSYTHTSWILKGGTSGVLREIVFSAELCAVFFSHHSFCRLLASSSKPRETTGLCLELPALLLWPRNSLKPVNWDNHEASLSFFLILRDHYLSLPDIQCL